MINLLDQLLTLKAREQPQRIVDFRQHVLNLTSGVGTRSHDFKGAFGAVGNGRAPWQAPTAFVWVHEDPIGAVGKACAEVEVAARATRQMPSVESLVERCGKSAGWQRLLYRMRLLSVPKEEARGACMLATKEGTPSKDGLPPGTAAATDSSVWLAEQDALATERVLMLMRLLGGEGVPARAVGGAVGELQRYVGCGEPILEAKHMGCKCAKEEWTSCTGYTEAKQGSTSKKRCESTCGWVGTWLGVLYIQAL